MSNIDGKAILHGLTEAANWFGNAILWLLTKTAEFIKIISTNTYKCLKWINPQLELSIAKGLGIITALVAGASLLASSLSGYDAATVDSFCGPPGKPPDGTCAGTTRLVFDFFSSQSPSQSAIDPLHYRPLVAALSAWNQHWKWVLVVAIFIAVFTIVMKCPTVERHPEGMHPWQAYFFRLIRDVPKFIWEQLLPYLRKRCFKLMIGAYMAVLLLNPLLSLGIVNNVEAKAITYVTAHTGGDPVTAGNKAEMAWTDTLYAQSHMGTAYKAQTTAAGRASVVELARRHRLGTLTPAQTKAYAKVYPFNPKGDDLSTMSTYAAHVHRTTLGAEIGALTVINKLAWLSLSILVFALPILVMRSRKLLLLAPAAALVAIGSQVLLGGVVKLDSTASAVEGFASFDATLLSVLLLLFVPALCGLATWGCESVLELLGERKKTVAARKTAVARQSTAVPASATQRVVLRKAA